MGGTFVNAVERPSMAEPDIDMDDADRAILNRIQADFPITSRPFLALAEELGLPEADVIARISRLKQAGIIRRIGGNFVPGKLGYVSTLCAARVPEEKVRRFAEAVNRHVGVTHNYLRDNTFNVWFTFIAPSTEDIEARLKEIAAETGVSEILNLPATKVFKIRAQFEV
jgi:DNA-binding Lrp family transcriptional regulator